MKTIGSRTATNGFANEIDVCQKFNNWQDDVVAKDWLTIMQYDLSKIEYVKAVVLSGYKTDVQVQVSIKTKDLIDAQNLQVKLVSNPKGYNQIDKRWVDKYQEMWGFDNTILLTLKQYTGELPASSTNLRDERRMFMDEFSDVTQTQLVKWFTDNKYLVVSDIMKGRGHFAAEWILVALKVDDSCSWTLKPMNVAMNHFASGDVCITSTGNVKIGRITMQRKGGDGGKETAKMLQFKLNPVELFDV